MTSILLHFLLLPCVPACVTLAVVSDLSQTPLAATSLETLRASLHGTVVTRDDARYEEVRKIWNAAVEKEPALFARCTNTADVVTALAFARDNGLEVAVRGGGHNIAGTALTDGGIVIDLQLMKELEVDAESRTLRAGPGLRLADVDRATQDLGLAAVAGINSETGLPGLILGGGIGWLMRAHGLTIDHLQSVEVVTANGNVVHASAKEEPDLFWALRGGGGNFGIVTQFELGLVPLGPEVYGGVAVYPAELAPQVLRAYRDWAAQAPEEVTTILIVRKAPPGWGPPELQGKPVLGIGALYSGSAAQGPNVLSPLENFGGMAASTFASRPWVSHQSMLDASSPAGRLYYWRSHNLPGLSDAAIDVICDQAWRFSSPYSYTLLSHMGGDIRRQSDSDSAFTGRSTEFAINITCGATERAHFESDREWVRTWFDALQPYSTGGVYVNFVGEEGSDRVRASYGESKYARLAQLKARLDPDNIFRTNQNIQPASGHGLGSG